MRNNSVLMLTTHLQVVSGMQYQRKVRCRSNTLHRLVSVWAHGWSRCTMLMSGHCSCATGRSLRFDAHLLLPVEVLSNLAPELLWLFDRLLVHPLVLHTMRANC